MHVMRALTRATVVAAAALLVGGCAGTGLYASEVAAGSRLVVHERLSISGYSGRVYVQDGEAMRRQAVDIYRPYCSFGLRRRGGESGAGEIRPGSFLVVRDSRQWYEASSGATDGVRVAATGLRGVAMIFEDGRSVDRYMLYTELELRSEEQPQVDNLRCQYFARTIDKQLERYPTLEQIDAALGGVATLSGPGG